MPEHVTLVRRTMRHAHQKGKQPGDENVAGGQIGTGEEHEDVRLKVGRQIGGRRLGRIRRGRA